MSLVVFGRTQFAFQTPFESEPERSNGFTSKNVQEAIEEALALAIANDRFPVLAKYNGNGNPGRLLEFYNGIDSGDAPYFFDAGANSLQIVGSTTAPSSNAMVNFYDVVNDPTMATPLYTFDYNGNKRVIDNGTIAVPLFTVPAGGALAIEVDSDSVNKPHFQMIFSSTI